jgi:hypothetical protein
LVDVLGGAVAGGLVAADFAAGSDRDVRGTRLLAHPVPSPVVTISDRTFARCSMLPGGRWIGYRLLRACPSDGRAAVEQHSVGYTKDVMPVVRLLEQRTFDTPRPVEVKHNGRWWTGIQTAWRLCDDGRGWMADCTWTEQHD